MDRYLIVSPHTAKDCDRALRQIPYAGYLTHFDWGCADGEHTGWAIVEADNAKEAIMVVPPWQRAGEYTIRLENSRPSGSMRSTRT